jgi:intein/homing endonuclease
VKAGEVGIKNLTRTYKQELITAAAWSKDPTMVNSYLVEPELCLPDGTKYPNPLSDLHLISAMNCVAPSLPSLATIFVGKPEWEWRKIADKSGARKSAKCVTGDTKVLTSSGWVEIRELVTHRKEGFKDFEKPIPIASISGTKGATQAYYGGTQKVFRLTLKNGLEIKATAEHKFLAQTELGFEWVKLSDLSKGQHLVMKLGSDLHGHNLSVPQINLQAVTSYKDLEIPSELTPALSRFLGLLISEGSLEKEGNGYSVSVGVEKVSIDFIPIVEECFSSLFNNKFSKCSSSKGVHFFISSEKLYLWMKQIEVKPGSGNQAIPSLIKQAPKALKVEFLKALFEGDGCVHKAVGGGNKICYDSKSKQLCLELQLELLNLGIASNITKEKRKKYGSYWRLNITGRKHISRFEEQIGFLTATKKASLKEAISNSQHGKSVVFVPGGRDYWRETIENPLCPKEYLADLRLRLRRNMLVGETLVDRLKPFIVDSTLKQLTDNNLWVVPVKEILEDGEEEVFDLYEPDTTAAIFNGIVAQDSLNFGSIYLMSYQTASENFCVKEEVAKSWLTGHRTTFPGYYAWAEEYGAIAAARGFAISPVSKLIRWVGNFLQPRYQVIGG